MKKSFLALTAGFFTMFFAACGSNTESDDLPEIQTSTEPADIAPMSLEAASPAEPLSNDPAPTPGATAVKLNPPHGEPGHDCAIPVGAPLDGSGGTTAQPLASPAAEPAKADAAASGVKINPPHGEPGHDCAVPVGAPLNK